VRLRRHKRLMRVARERGLEVRLLDLRNSGDTGAERARVVGYGAFALYETRVGVQRMRCTAGQGWPARSGCEATDGVAAGRSRRIISQTGS